jgi:hypothetical protein
LDVIHAQPSKLIPRIDPIFKQYDLAVCKLALSGAGVKLGVPSLKAD